LCSRPPACPARYECLTNMEANCTRRSETRAAYSRKKKKKRVKLPASIPERHTRESEQERERERERGRGRQREKKREMRLLAESICKGERER
jgi:hypothetical protein